MSGRVEVNFQGSGEIEGFATPNKLILRSLPPQSQRDTISVYMWLHIIERTDELNQITKRRLGVACQALRIVQHVQSAEKRMHLFRQSLGRLMNRCGD